MAEIGRWGGHKFEVSSNVIRGMEALTIKGSSETEEKESGGQKYVSRKNGKPAEVSMTICLHAAFGCEVRDEAMALVDEAIAGKKDYFYVGNKKLVSCQLMLIEASVKEVGITNNGTWTRADISVTMKQCTKNDGTVATSSGSSGGGSSSGSSSSGSKKTSTKTTGVVSNIVKTTVANAATAAKKAVTNAKNAITGITNKTTNKVTQVVNAVKAVKSVTTNAKSASSGSKAKAVAKTK